MNFVKKVQVGNEVPKNAIGTTIATVEKTADDFISGSGKYLLGAAVTEATQNAHSQVQVLVLLQTIQYLFMLKTKQEN